MMNPLTQLDTVIRVTSIGIGGAIARCVGKLGESMCWDEYQIIAFTTAAVLLVSLFVAWFLHLIVEHWPLLRTVLFGGRYIEGRWLDIKADGSATLLTIEAEGTSLSVHGENFSASGDRTYEFDSIDGMLKFSWPQLTFHFDATAINNSAIGKTVLTFGSRRPCRPMHYSGVIRHHKEVEPNTLVDAKRLTTKEEEMLVSVKGRKQLIHQFQSERNGPNVPLR